MGKILFVTGTDTGVGKTVFTGLLLLWLRTKGIKALALKPFSSGDRRDAELFWRLQDQQIPIDVVNPYHFSETIAPLVAARKHRQQIALESVVDKVKSIQRQCDWLLVEGCGGLMAPICEHATVADLIEALGCSVAVIAPNKLGAINHTLMTVHMLNNSATPLCGIVLVAQRHPDEASKTNPAVIRELLSCNILRLPYLRRMENRLSSIKKNFQKNEKTLAQVMNAAIVGIVREQESSGRQKR